MCLKYPGRAVRANLRRSASARGAARAHWPALGRRSPPCPMIPESSYNRRTLGYRPVRPPEGEGGGTHVRTTRVERRDRHRAARRRGGGRRRHRRHSLAQLRRRAVRPRATARLLRVRRAAVRGRSSGLPRLRHALPRPAALARRRARDGEARRRLPTAGWRDGRCADAGHSDSLPSCSRCCTIPASCAPPPKHRCADRSSPPRTSREAQRSPPTTCARPPSPRMRNSLR